MATSAPNGKCLLSLASEWNFSSGMSCLFSIKCSIVKKNWLFWLLFHMSCFTGFIGLSFIYVIVMMISVLKYFPNFSLSLTCISFWKRTSYLIYTNADEQISHLDVSVKRSGYYGNFGSLRAGTRHHGDFSVMGTSSLQPFLKSYWLTPVKWLANCRKACKYDELETV